MPTLVVSVPGPVIRRRAALVAADGQRYDFRHSPVDVEHTGWAPEHAEVERPGRAPLTIKRSEAGYAVAVRWVIGHPDPDQSIENELLTLRSICAPGQNVRLDWGPSEAGWWVAVSLSATTTMRTPEGHISRADMALDLRRAVKPDGGAITDLVRPVAA